MNAILNVIVMWLLVQLLVVWFCARVASAREVDIQTYLELREYLARSGLDSLASERLALASAATATPKPVPPAGVARA